MKKYIFIDIDGTLTNFQKEVTNATIEAINDIEKSNYEIVLCSGRYNKYLIDLSTKCRTSRYLISSNGSMIYDQKEQKILYQNKIPFDILKNIYNYCQTNKMAMYINTEYDRYFCDFEKKEYTKKDIKIFNDIEELKEKNITQFVLGSYKYDTMTKVKEYIDKIPELEIVNFSTTIKLKQKDSKDGFFYDVVLKGNNKGTGITNFINIMKIPKNNCIAIGDHINDVDMFNAVNYKIAMGNACDELKEKADYITKTNDEDGVKYALEHLKKEFL